MSFIILKWLYENLEPKMVFYLKHIIWGIQLYSSNRLYPYYTLLIRTILKEEVIIGLHQN